MDVKIHRVLYQKRFVNFRETGFKIIIEGFLMFNSANILRLTVLLISMLGLAACGGGGGGGVGPTGYTVGGDISGHTGDVSLVLNGGTPITVNSQDSSFIFSSQVLNTGDNYAVDVTAPTGQTCILTGSGGQINNSNISNISVKCENLIAGTYSIGGRVSGLTTGLSVFLSLNNGTPVEITGNNQFTFSNQLLGLGDSYSVAVSTQPATLDCKGIDATGNVADNVTNIVIDCKVPTYTVGGTVSGHRGDVTLSLNNDGVNTVIVTKQDSTFTFSGATQALNIGATYAVTATDPTGQTCKVDLGVSQGTIARADVVDVSVVCDDINYSIGGNITNLNSGSSIGLTLNGGAEYKISTDTLITNSQFTMPTTVNIDNKYAYSVKVKTSPVGQTCAVTGGDNKNGTGFASADVTDIAIACSNVPFNISGSVTGLNTGSSISLTLSIADGAGKFVSGQPILVKANTPVSSPSSFTFPNQVININQLYKVDAVIPAGQTCLVDLGVSNGKALGANINDISVVCSNIGYSVGGKGIYTGSGLTLSLNGGTPLPVTSNIQFTFPTKLNIINEYNVTIGANPTGLTCSVTKGNGTIGTANVTNVGFSCSTTTYTIGGNVNNLKKPIVLVNNLSDPLTVSPAVSPAASTTFTFNGVIGFNNPYDVTIKTQPSNQFCTPGLNASNLKTTANIANIAIDCVDVYDVRVDVSGLKGGTVTLLNGGVEFPINVNGISDIVTGLKVSDPYNVTIRNTPDGLPIGQSCTLTPNAAGPTIGAADVSVNVVCSDIPRIVGGTITGILTSSVRMILSKNTVDYAAVSFATVGRFDFPTTQPVGFGDSYAVRIVTQPTSETCFVDTTSSKGKVATANIVDVAVNCINNLVDTDGDSLPDITEQATCPLTSVDPYCSLRDNPDTDNDTYRDDIDAFPNDFDEWLDTDGDKIGNNADPDDDNDKVDDVNDFFPLDSTRWAKTVLDLSSLKGNNGIKFNGINSDDFSGVSVSSADVNGDTIPDLIIGANGANGDNSLGTDQKSDPGETYVIFGQDNVAWPASFDLSTLDGTNGFIIKGNRANDRSGISVSGLGDINGDGKADFIIGAAEADTDSGTTTYANKEAGKAYVIYGRLDWTGTPVLNLSTKTFPVDPANPTLKLGFTINGVNAGDLTGNSVKNAGDINNDGVSDIIIGARGKLSASTPGYSYVLFGKTSAWTNEFNLSSLAADTTAANGFVINGINSEDFSGWSVSGAGDINGDTYDDILIGARDASAAGVANAGETYVIFGRASTATWAPTFDLSTLATGGGAQGFVIQGISVGDQSGSSVSSAGDINGDTVADIIIGAQKSDPNGIATAGESYVVFGRAVGGVAWPAIFKLSSLATGAGADGFIIQGIASNDQNGIAVSGAGDVNGDGIDDFISSASLADVASFTDAGESYVIFGRPSGTPWSSTLKLSTLSAGTADGSVGFVARGINMSDNSGIAISSAGDFNNDGFTDFIIGASKADVNGVSSAGETYVIFGCDYFTAINLCITNLP
jgi:hypothetical protein